MAALCVLCMKDPEYCHCHDFSCPCGGEGEHEPFCPVEETEAQEAIAAEIKSLRQNLDKAQDDVARTHRGARNLAALAELRLHEVWKDLTDEAVKKWEMELAEALADYKAEMKK